MLLPAPDAHGIIRLSNGIIINRKLADTVFTLPYEAYMAGEKLHSFINHATSAPQKAFIPKGVTPGDEWHRIWFFFAAMTDRREVSERVYASHQWLWDNVRWIYGPGIGSSFHDMDRYITRLTAVHHIKPVRQLSFFAPVEEIDETLVVTEIERLLRQRKVGVPGQSAAYWPRSARTLYSTFGGDPIAIYRRFGTINEILAFKNRKGGEHHDFAGFGSKLWSLLALFYAELGLIEMPADAIPVDVHLQRIALATEVVRYQGTERLTNEMLEDCLRLLLCEICAENGWTTIDLSHALWFNGKYLCSNCSKNKAVEDLCPMYSVCKGAHSSVSYFRRGFWYLNGNRQRVGTGNGSLFPKT